MLRIPTERREWAMNLSGIFQDEIERLEQLYLFSPWLSKMYAQTLVEAAFLSLVMDQMVDIDFLRTVNSTLVDSILERFPENLQQIASQWHSFTTNSFSAKAGRSQV